MVVCFFLSPDIELYTTTVAPLQLIIIFSLFTLSVVLCREYKPGENVANWHIIDEKIAWKTINY